MAARVSSAEQPTKSRRPEFASAATGATHPRIDQTPPFVLVFNPERFMVHAGKFVPSLSRIPLVAGVNNVSQTKDGRFLFAKTRANIEMEGRIVIPHEWAPDGESYCQVVMTRPDGRPDAVEAWITVWETATVGSTDLETDAEGYAEWLDGLVKAGKLPACPLVVANRMKVQAAARLQTAQNRVAVAKDPGLAAQRVAALSAELKILEDYVGQIQAERKQKAVAKRDTPKMEG